MLHAQGPGEWSVCFDDDTVGLAERGYLRARVEGVDLDLVDGGFDARGRGEEFL